jgi:transposase
VIHKDHAVFFSRRPSAPEHHPGKMKTYSLDLRQKIVDTYDDGGISQRELAERFRVSVFFVKKLFRQRRIHGTIEPLPRNGWQKGILNDEMHSFLATLLETETPKLRELADLIEREYGIRPSHPTVHRAIKRLKSRAKTKKPDSIKNPANLDELDLKAA